MRFIEAELANDEAGLPWSDSKVSSKGLTQPEPGLIALLDVCGDSPNLQQAVNAFFSGSDFPASDRSGGRAVDSGIVAGPLLFPKNELLYLSGCGLG